MPARLGGEVRDAKGHNAKARNAEWVPSGHLEACAAARSWPCVHPDVNLRSPPDSTRPGAYKTELCKWWLEGAGCPFADKCAFAHGSRELRLRPRPSNYKTQLCRKFVMNGGMCPYGHRCLFIHSLSLPSVQLSVPTASVTTTASRMSVDEPFSGV